MGHPDRPGYYHGPHGGAGAEGPDPGHGHVPVGRIRVIVFIHGEGFYYGDESQYLKSRAEGWFGAEHRMDDPVHRRGHYGQREYPVLEDGAGAVDGHRDSGVWREPVHAMDTADRFDHE